MKTRPVPDRVTCRVTVSCLHSAPQR
jgi:hypothetical protein